MAVDLGEDFSISKIATQGKLDDKDRYITLYGLQYSSDAKKWTDYKDIFGNAVSNRSRTSVIRQKGESQNGYFKKTKHVKFSEKRTFLTP